MAYSFSLSLAALDILLENLNLGRAPMPFVVPHIGTTVEERAHAREAVFRELEGRRLAAHGRLDADAELMLRTFVQAPVAIAAVAQLDGGRQLFARAATNGRFAVIAHRQDNALIFADIRTAAIVPSIVDLLPPVPPAGGQSVTVANPAPQRTRHARDEDAYDPFANVSAPRARTTASAQLRAVERIFQRPKLRIGQFTAFVNGSGPLSPTAWFDTPEGRYFVTTRAAEDGQSWMTYAPADSHRIGQHLHTQLQGRS
ncbi:MAG TPA: ESX secretion-associated protein EspG [Amycolatopsis sp.]|nr:ESX secretion-associated protein EspG [Amycolatopsis sp.]